MTERIRIQPRIIRKVFCEKCDLSNETDVTDLIDGAKRQAKKEVIQDISRLMCKYKSFKKAFEELKKIHISGETE